MEDVLATKTISKQKGQRICVAILCCFYLFLSGGKTPCSTLKKLNFSPWITPNFEATKKAGPTPLKKAGLHLAIQIPLNNLRGIVTTRMTWKVFLKREFPKLSLWPWLSVLGVGGTRRSQFQLRTRNWTNIYRCPKWCQFLIFQCLPMQITYQCVHVTHKEDWPKTVDKLLSQSVKHSFQMMCMRKIPNLVNRNHSVHCFGCLWKHPTTYLAILPLLFTMPKTELCSFFWYLVDATLYYPICVTWRRDN